ncbi:MAG: ABC transporter ATP-binding protein [Solirubrobacterales bacterium]|nr:ABC transporter ATP-binding protein [Solirubrobacterales bacterium]
MNDGQVLARPHSPGLSIEATLARGGFRAEVVLDLPGGGALALLGPNGAGKSTVLRAVAGLDPIVAGTIRIGGRTVADPDRGIGISAGKRGVGYVFQDYRLFPHLDVLDNVAFGIRATGASRKASRRRAGEVLERAGLERFSSAQPGDLSGGESQQVAVARALASGPHLLLLDEPLAALDVENRADMREHLKRVIANFDATVLLVTHDPGDALAVTDRIAIIEAGRVVQRGTGRELSAAPATAWVARLVGRTGISGEVPAGAVVEPGGVVVFRTAAGPMRGRAVGLLPGDPFPPGPVFASFNPAAVRIGDPGTPGGHAALPNFWPAATVSVVEPDLGRTMFELDLEPDAVGSTTVRAATSPERASQLRPGDRIKVEIPPDTIQITPTNQQPPNKWVGPTSIPTDT